MTEKKDDVPVNSYLVRVEGLVPRVDQIAVEAPSVEDAEEKAVEIASDEGFVDAHAVTAVPVARGAVVPHDIPVKGDKKSP